ncbi:unnamed protein product [Heligmosomoides polygyrus]|uniref:Uncharacterized protein n=1 Tax=Heligmosomoides polygyrus TaxID=6339 RepID=A0A3P8E1N3_HELPZ|nr:unnamed protein product [Heligmosomoides polygyrus]
MVIFSYTQQLLRFRVDLPVKKLEDLSRARMKCARHLRKMDVKKEEYINLWKLCNIYSVTAVDVDDAMREIRNSLRKRMKPKETSRDVSTFRRLIDEYRPAKKASSADHQQEIYDNGVTKLRFCLPACSLIRTLTALPVSPICNPPQFKH